MAEPLRASCGHTAACTIISKNYISFARVLAASFRAQHPEAEFYVLLVDRVDGYFDPNAEPFTLVCIDELDIPDRNRFYFQYRLIELNTAVKPYFLEHLLRAYGIAKVLYLDPDILVMNSLRGLYAVLDDYNIVLTPHITLPIKDEYRPSEVDIMRVGTHNLGFIGVRNTPGSLGMLRWWQERLFDKCFVALERGLFID